MKFDSKLAFEDHGRGIVRRVSQRIGILRIVKRIFVYTAVLLGCYFASVLPILEHCSPVWGSATKCHLQLLERQVYSVARLCPDRASCRCAIDVMLLGLVCCTVLIRPLITCSAIFHLLLRLRHS